MTSHDRYQPAIQQIDELLTQRHAEGLGPGLSLALTTNDDLLATRTYGVANADSREPVTERTLFQIGSITKHFTAAACLRLHEQGRLDVNAPVTEVLDWFEVKSRFAASMTIHHLLTHTSGMIMMMDCYPSSWWQTWALRDTELGFEPGAKFSYSNVGYNVLQCMIQTITGLSFDASLRELVLEPLEMRESFGEIRNGLYDRMAKGHKYSAHDDRPVPRPIKQTVVNWYELSEGCATAVTTPTDLARFLRMLLNGGRADDGSEFLNPSTFKMMTHPWVEMQGFFPGTMQGYGVLIEQSEDTNDHRRIIGGGENLGFEAAMYGDFDAGVGVILFCNSFDVPWQETRWLLDTLVAASRGEEPPRLPELRPLFPQPLGEKASEYVGSYRSDDRTFTITDEDGHLSLASDGTTARLEPIWGDSFLATHSDFDHAMLSFGRNEERQVVEAFQLGDWYRNEAYEGPESYDVPAEWDAYVGHYRAFGVLVGSLKFFVRKGQLICQSFGGYADNALTDLGNGTFRVGDETSPHRMTFDSIADSRALRCRASDGDLYRVE
jgi:CubicO group peptidase (beta-lactamase class C family)